VTWSRAFDDPIPLPDGGEIRTLREAGNYIMALPGSARQSSEWQAAAEAVLMAAEGRGPLEHARIGMLRALNAGKPDPKLSPRRKRAKAYKIVG
jgi:hypothetical protein